MGSHDIWLLITCFPAPRVVLLGKQKRGHLLHFGQGSYSIWAVQLARNCNKWTRRSPRRRTGVFTTSIQRTTSWREAAGLGRHQWEQNNQKYIDLTSPPCVGSLYVELPLALSLSVYILVSRPNGRRLTRNDTLGVCSQPRVNRRFNRSASNIAAYTAGHLISSVSTVTSPMRSAVSLLHARCPPRHWPPPRPRPPSWPLLPRPGYPPHPNHPIACPTHTDRFPQTWPLPYARSSTIARAC